MLTKPVYFAIPLFFLLFFSTHSSISSQTLETTGRYHIRISERDPLLALVEAQIPIKDGRLFMAPWGADHLPAGWATFVRNLRISDESNRPLVFEPGRNGVFQISNRFAGRVNLSYEVDLSFTKAKWKYGNEQAGTFQDHA